MKNFSIQTHNTEANSVARSTMSIIENVTSDKTYCSFAPFYSANILSKSSQS